MSELLKMGEPEDDRLLEILKQAEDRYGADALFVYPKPQQKQFIALTLVEAMAICGEFIADEDPELLWRTLDKWHSMAGVLAEKSPIMFEKARELGRSVLSQRGITVGDSGGETA